MTIRHLGGIILRRLFPGRMELRDMRIAHSNSLKQIQKEANLNYEQWVDKIKQQYSLAMRCELNLDKPEKLTEKIQYRKLYEHNPLYSRLTDKYAVREWIKEQIGEQYLIPILGVWEKAEHISFDTLPNRFVLKTNNASGTNIIVKDKGCINKKQIIEQLNYWLEYPFWALYGEFHYKDIKPKIIAEEYISQLDDNLLDYKIYCFNGTPEFILIIGDRDAAKHTGKEAIYDFKWNRLPWIFEDYPAYTYELAKPSLLEELYRISKKLCKEFGFVRVDLYIVDNQIKFGEMTFTPGCGIFPYKGTWNERLDYQYGKKIRLEGKEKE